MFFKEKLFWRNREVDQFLIVTEKVKKLHFRCIFEYVCAVFSHL